MTHRERLLLAFRDAGKRGLTTKQMREYGGVDGVKHYGELQDLGYAFQSAPSQFDRRKVPRPWRHWLVYEPPAPKPEPATSPVEPEPLALFEAPAPPAPAPTPAVFDAH